MLITAAIPAVLPGHGIQSAQTAATHAAALVSAADVVAALPGCCVEEVQADVVPMVFILLLSLVTAAEADVKAAALKALKAACAKHTDAVRQGCAHALCKLNDSLGKPGAAGNDAAARLCCGLEARGARARVASPPVQCPRRHHHTGDDSVNVSRDGLLLAVALFMGTPACANVREGQDEADTPPPP